MRPRAGGAGAPARSSAPSRHPVAEWALMLLGVVSQVYLTAMLTLLAITLLPLAFGWHSTLVTSGSMEPHISRGDVVLLVDLEDDDPVPLGGVVQFRSPAAAEPSGEDRTRLHRIVSEAADGTYVTAGDANNDVDSAPLTRDLITGQGRLLVPYVGLPALWLSKGLLGPLALWSVLTVTAVVLAARAIRRQTDPDGPDGEPGPGPDGNPGGDPDDGVPDDDASHDDAPDADNRPRARRSITTATASGLVVALALAASVVLPVRESVAGFTARTVNPGSTWSASDIFRAIVYNYRGAILADRPWLYYPLNEESGFVAADVSGNGREGRYGFGGGPGITGALVNETNHALSFYGSPFLNLATPEPAVAAPTTFTVELWFRAASGQNGELAAFGNRASGLSTQYDRALYLAPDGRLNFGILDRVHRVVTSPSRYDDNAWHHVTATLGGGTMTLYVDGTSVGTQRNVTPQAFAGYWRIGGDNLLLWPDRPSNPFFTGSIDEVSISSTTALSAARVRAHHQAALPTSTTSYVSEVLADAPSAYYRFEEGQPGTLTDSSGNGQHTSYPRTGVTYGTEGPLTTMNNVAANFSGFLSTLTTQDEHANPQELTLEGWFRTSTTRGGQIIGFASSRSILASRQDRQLYLADDGRVVFGVEAGTRRAIASPASYNDGAWHHVAATLSAAGSTLYVDGQPVASDPAMNRAAAHDGYWITGGGRPTRFPIEPSSTYLSAALDEIVVYPRALTPAQIEAHFAAR